MSGPELPVIYENPRFDQATPTLWPVFDRAIRFTLVILMEWGTLTLIEDSPRYVKLATVIVAAAGLAVHESWPWLRMRDRRWYPALITILATSYSAIFFYALYTEPTHKGQTTQAHAPVTASVGQQTSPTKLAWLTDTHIDWNGGFGSIVFQGKFTRTGEKLDVFLEWGTLIGQAPVFGGFVNWDGRRSPIEFKDRTVRNAELKVTVAHISKNAGDQSILQLGDDPDLKVGLTSQGYAVKIILVSQSGEEESYSFAVVPTDSEFFGKPPHTLIIDSAAFSGRGNM